MYNADSVVAMNADQLVTVTDRLLAGRGRRPAPRASVPASLALPVPAPTVRASSASRIVFSVAIPFVIGFSIAVLL